MQLYLAWVFVVALGIEAPDNTQLVQLEPPEPIEPPALLARPERNTHSDRSRPDPELQDRHTPDTLPAQAARPDYKDTERLCKTLRIPVADSYIRMDLEDFDYIR